MGTLQAGDLQSTSAGFASLPPPWGQMWCIQTRWMLHTHRPGTPGCCAEAQPWTTSCKMKQSHFSVLHDGGCGGEDGPRPCTNTKLQLLMEHWMRKTCRLAGKVFYNSRHKEGTTATWGRRAKSGVRPPRWAAPRRKRSYRSRAGGLSPTAGSPSQGPCVRRKSPNVWL